MLSYLLDKYTAEIVFSDAPRNVETRSLNYITYTRTENVKKGRDRRCIDSLSVSVHQPDIFSPFLMLLLWYSLLLYFITRKPKEHKGEMAMLLRNKN